MRRLRCPVTGVVDRRYLLGVLFQRSVPIETSRQVEIVQDSPTTVYLTPPSLLPLRSDAPRLPRTLTLAYRGSVASSTRNGATFAFQQVFLPDELLVLCGRAEKYNVGMPSSAVVAVDANHGCIGWLPRHEYSADIFAATDVNTIAVNAVPGTTHRKHDRTL